MKIQSLDIPTTKSKTILVSNSIDVVLDNGNIFNLEEKNGKLHINVPGGKIVVLPCVSNVIEIDII